MLFCCFFSIIECYYNADGEIVEDTRMINKKQSHDLCFLA